MDDRGRRQGQWVHKRADGRWWWSHDYADDVDRGWKVRPLSRVISGPPQSPANLSARPFSRRLFGAASVFLLCFASPYSPVQRGGGGALPAGPTPGRLPHSNRHPSIPPAISTISRGFGTHTPLAPFRPCTCGPLPRAEPMPHSASHISFSPPFASASVPPARTPARPAARGEPPRPGCVRAAPAPTAPPRARRRRRTSRRRSTTRCAPCPGAPGSS
jgi:hypothetical protein